MLEELEQYKDQAQELAGMAARLAGEYRRAGMSQSAAMKRAWAETKKAALSARARVTMNAYEKVVSPAVRAPCRALLPVFL